MVLNPIGSSAHPLHSHSLLFYLLVIDLPVHCHGTETKSRGSVIPRDEAHVDLNMSLLFVSGEF